MGEINSKKEVILEIKRLHKTLGRRPKRDDNVRLNSMARKFFGIWTNALESAGYEVKRDQKPKIPDKLTPELCYFIGLLITDGHLVENIKRSDFFILLYTSYEEEKDLIVNLTKKLFDYVPHIRERMYGFNKRINYEIKINSKELLYHFKDTLELPTGAKSRIVRVPKYFFKLDKKLIINFVRGLIDGDGTVSSHINISSGSILFLEDLKQLLSCLKINTGDIKDRGTAYVLGFHNKFRIYNLIYKKSKLYYPRKKEAFRINTFKNQSYS